MLLSVSHQAYDILLSIRLSSLHFHWKMIQMKLFLAQFYHVEDGSPQSGSFTSECDA